MGNHTIASNMNKPAILILISAETNHICLKNSLVLIFNSILVHSAKIHYFLFFLFFLFFSYFSVIWINRSRSAMLMQAWHCAHLITILLFMRRWYSPDFYHFGISTSTAYDINESSHFLYGTRSARIRIRAYAQGQFSPRRCPKRMKAPLGCHYSRSVNFRFCPSKS